MGEETYEAPLVAATMW